MAATKIHVANWREESIGFLSLALCLFVQIINLIMLILRFLSARLTFHMGGKGKQASAGSSSATTRLVFVGVASLAI